LPRIEKLAIKLDTALLSGERTPVIDATRMMEQKCRLGIPDELCDRTGEAAVGNADTFDRERLFISKCHRVSPAVAGACLEN
jgi:hypothetical protein